MVRFFLLLLLSFFTTSMALEIPEYVKLDKMARTNLEKISEAIAKEFQIELLSTHTGAMIDSNEVSWCSKFMIRHLMTADEMQPIVQAMFKHLWQSAQNEPSYKRSVIAASKATKLFADRVFSPNLFGLKIVFWDMEMNRPLHPYVAQIVVKESRIHYYYADPKTQALIEPPVIEEFPKDFF